MTNEFFRLIVITFLVGALLLGLGIAALCFLAFTAGNLSRIKRDSKTEHQIPGWVPVVPETITAEPLINGARRPVGKEINLPFIAVVLFFGVLITVVVVSHSILPLIIGGLVTLICHLKTEYFKSINFALVALVECFGILIAVSIAWHTPKPILLIGMLILIYRERKNHPERIPPTPPD